MNQLGSFVIANEFFQKYPIALMAQAFAELKFVPLRAEVLVNEQGNYYVGYSPFFVAIESGEKVPSYHVVVVERRENKEDPEEITSLGIHSVNPWDAAPAPAANDDGGQGEAACTKLQ